MFSDFQDLKNEVRAQVRDSSDSQFSDRLDLAIQQVYMEFRQQLRSPYNTQRLELTPDSTGQATVGDEFLAAEYVSFEDGTGTQAQEYPLEPMTGDMHIMKSRDYADGTRNVCPTHYRMFGSAIRVRPFNYASDDLANTKIIIEGWYRPPILKSSTQTSDDKRLLGNIGHLALSGICWRLFEYKQDFDAADRWRGIFERDMRIVNALEVTRRS